MNSAENIHMLNSLPANSEEHGLVEDIQYMEQVSDERLGQNFSSYPLNFNRCNANISHVQSALSSFREASLISRPNSTINSCSKGRHVHEANQNFDLPYSEELDAQLPETQ